MAALPSLPSLASMHRCLLFASQYPAVIFRTNPDWQRTLCDGKSFAVNLFAGWTSVDDALVRGCWPLGHLQQMIVLTCQHAAGCC